MDQSKMKIAYVIKDLKGQKYWNRIGVAFVNHDGSINVKLDAVPVNGEIQIRDYVPRDDLATSRTRQNGHHDEEEVLALT